MPKSRLGTKEIIRLKDRGISIPDIAKQSGTTKQCVRIRLSPVQTERNRRYGKEYYRTLQNDDRKTYIEVQKKLIQKAQDETSLLAEKIGEPWTKEELDHLREWGGIKTAKELAIELNRTFFAVKHTTQRYKIPLRK